MERIELITNLIQRKMADPMNPAKCSEPVKEAVHILLEAVLCDLKFDRGLLNELLMIEGWTPEDVEYFDLWDLFKEEEE